MTFIAPSLLGIMLLALYLSTRWAWWRPAAPLTVPRILMYHMICETKPRHKFRGLRVTPEAFEQQVIWLKKNGWSFITMSELFDAPDRAKRVAITFDDGFADNYTNAFPILKKHSGRATLYLVGDRHNREWSTNRKKHHNTGELAKEQKVTDDQVQEMITSGVFELGGHTLTHRKLTELSVEEKRNEIVESKIRQEVFYNTQLSSFAYPFGIFDENDIQIVKEAGYKTAVTAHEGAADLNTPFTLRRVKVSGKEGLASFKLRIRTGKRKL